MNLSAIYIDTLYSQGFSETCEQEERMLPYFL